MLEGMHYSQSKLDDKLSATVYTRYLESIDSQHTSLLASDVADFEQYKLRFDDMIRSGDVDPAFAIFARFQQRNRERIKYRDRAARQGAGLDAERILRIQSREIALGGRSCRARRVSGASASRTMPSRCC